MFNLFRQKNKPVRISLEALSLLWTSQDTHRDPGVTEDEEPSFGSGEIQRFYLKYVQPHARGKELTIIRNLLATLDHHGHCASVVEHDDETPQPYRVLADVTLAEHTLSVSRKAFQMLNAGRQLVRTNTPDLLIAALGHDIGKMPHTAHSDLPGHTLNTIAFLKPQLKGLEAAPEIIEAIRLLHVDKKDRSVQSANLILPILQQADIQAREAELGMLQPAELKQAANRTGRPGKEPPEPAVMERFVEITKPLLLKDAQESFISGDMFYLSSAFVEQIIENSEFDPGEARNLMSSFSPPSTFIVRFFKKGKSLTQKYIQLNKDLFGDLPDLEEQQNALGVKKVIPLTASQG
ncbi:MAG: hypothetical protein BA868_00585 [Desulfobacterales bacterium C00003106]|nr:MAG: hypothetical protein BA868_00585 [Desulfobacterales bacterium C00003106]